MKTKTVYKLTDAEMMTDRGRCWELGVEKTGSLEYPLRASTHPLLAELLNPIHDDFGSGRRLFRGRGVVAARYYGLYVDCKNLTLVKELHLPVITAKQRVRFAILCAWDVYRGAKWRTWARKWLEDEDKSRTKRRTPKLVGIQQAADNPRASAASYAESAAKMMAWGNEDDDLAHAAARAAEEAAEFLYLDLKQSIDLIALAKEAMTEARR